jgi:hypothetical protein
VQDTCIPITCNNYKQVGCTIFRLAQNTLLAYNILHALALRGGISYCKCRPCRPEGMLFICSTGFHQNIQHLANDTSTWADLGGHLPGQRIYHGVFMQPNL